jgi:FkbM family methyltransferase
MKKLHQWLYYIGSIFRIIAGFRNWPKTISLFLRPKATGEYSIKLRHAPITLNVRGAMDVWAVKETFLDEFYTRYGVPMQDGWTVVDIGAGIGDFSIYAAFGRPDAKVYAFEPYPGSFLLLNENLEQNTIENVFPFQQAVWGNAGELTLDLSVGEPLQFSSREVVVESGKARQIKVNAVTLADVLTEHALDSVDLLKLDCEGAEYEILMNAPEDTLAKIQRIVMEYHNVDDEHMHTQLIRFLEAAGYTVSWEQNIVHEEIGYLFAARVM